MEKELDAKKIAEQFGRRTPFTVPEGYFEDFAAQMMKRVDAQPVTEPSTHVEPVAEEAKTAQIVPMRRRWMRRVAVAAASICVAIGGVSVYLSQSDQGAQTAAVTAQSSTSTQATYSELDAMADYAMLDAQDLYAYMSDAK